MNRIAGCSGPRLSLRLLTTSATALVTCVLLTTPAASAAPGAAPSNGESKTRVIVRFDAGLDPDVETRRVEADGAKVSRTYRTVFPGFAAEVPEQAMARLRKNPRVVSIEPIIAVTASETQSPATWGLDRIDQRPLPLSGSFTFPAKGAGVTAYVVDTGINAGHSDFGGRVGSGYTAIADGRGTTDCNGHGTHVAGTTAGATSGVAKAAALVAVRVLDCAGSGWTDDVIAGLDWIAADHRTGTPAVVNLSLGSSASPAVDAAVQSLINEGVPVAVAAGNANTDACSSSPGRLPAALTVGASSRTDARASFSDHGSCLDLFAPGVNIVSDSHSSNTGTVTMSGTSMAAPHVAGAAAVLLSQQPSLTPAGVASRLLNDATPNVITDARTGSPNRLLYLSPTSPAPLSVTNPGSQSATVGIAKSLQLTAAGGAGPYSWSGTGLPPGLTLGATTGLISGTPTTAGNTSSTVTATDSTGATATTTFAWAVAAPAPVGPSFHAVTPARLQDTRAGFTTVDGQFAGTGAFGAGQTRNLTVAGRGPVPANATSVVLNVTVTGPTTAGSLTVFSAGDVRPTNTNVNFAPDQTVANSVAVKVGTGGQIVLFNATGSSHVIVDVVGYFDSATAFEPLNAPRILDTRTGTTTVDGQFAATGPIGPGTTVELPVAGRGGVPATGVRGVVLNVTVTAPTAASHLTVFPTGLSRPNAANLNYTANKTVSNAVTVPVGTDGKVSLYNAAGSAQVAVTVAGYFPSTAAFSGLTPARLLDTRPGFATIDGQYAGAGSVGPGATLQLPVTGRGGVPAAGVGSVVLNVTVTAPTSASHLTVFPTGQLRPNTANLNYTANQTVPNMVFAKVGTDGKVSLFNFAGSAAVIVDVAGWFPP